MRHPPFFQRTPRLLEELPSHELEIPTPPPAPQRPTFSLLSLVPMLAGTALSLTLPLLLGGGSASHRSYLLFSLPMTLVSALYPVFAHWQQMRAFRSAQAARSQAYRAALQKLRGKLEATYQRQQQVMCQVNPDPAECFRRVHDLDVQLWQRSAADADFLAIRLGLGSAPLSVRVKAPAEPAIAVESDPLHEEAAQLAADFQRVAHVPALLPLRALGAIGITGPLEAACDLVRAMGVQIATHHSPDEVKVAAIFAEAERDHWSWTRWLPHVWSDQKRRYLASDREGAARLLSSIEEQLRRRLPSDGEQGAAPLPHFIIYIAAPSLVEGCSALATILELGPRLGATVVAVVPGHAELPRECRAIVQADRGGGRLIFTGAASSAANTAFMPDPAPLDQAEFFSRAMAPIRLRRMASPGVLPGALPLLDLFGTSRVEELDVLSCWAASDAGRSLAVPIGVAPGGESVCLDLHERGHGPHGLVAGTTGSGKSELLQTLIVSLALHFHPHDLALILVDYKGGALANVFRDLPHLVGSITNLQGNLAARALAALKGELKRRQALLSAAGVGHVDEFQRLYRAGQASEPLPHLLFLVDEFAELKAEQPDFMRELVSAVRVGRSLGIHLILATQKPSGVVDDQIWSNSRFRLCLRVERPEDSREVLRRPDAADLTQPGRAFFQVGNGERFDLFQAAWGGAPYTPGGPVTSTASIAEVVLDGSRYVLSHLPRPATLESLGPQLQAVVRQICAAAAEAGVKRLDGPWLPPLPEEVLLPTPAAGWDGAGWPSGGPWLQPVIGEVDDPANRIRAPLRLPLGREGHVAIYGAPGSGKTTLLQTLVTSLARSHSPAEAQLYLLDCGGRSLSVFHELPHAGAVIHKDEEERVERCLRLLLAEMSARKESFARQGVTTLSAYREAAHGGPPAILLIIDSYAGFAESFPDLEDGLAQIAREGGNLGIHLVITATTRAAVRSRVADNITGAIALQLADPSEYPMTVGRTGGLVPMPVPGRGLIKQAPPLEFQTALPIAGESEAERSQHLRELARRMNQAWAGARPAPVRTLPESAPLVELVERRPVPLGLEVQNLIPLQFDLAEGPHFLVTGPAQSGKTSLLQTMALALAFTYSPAELALYLADFRADGLCRLGSLPHVRACITEENSLQEALNGFANERGGRRAVLLMDDLETVRDQAYSDSKEQLERMIRRERGPGLHIVMAGAANTLGSAWDGFIKAIRDTQTGFLLGSGDHGDAGLLNFRVPPADAGKLLAPGLGFYARRGRARKFLAASPYAGGMTEKAWSDLLKEVMR